MYQDSESISLRILIKVIILENQKQVPDKKEKKEKKDKKPKKKEKEEVKDEEKEEEE